MRHSRMKTWVRALTALTLILWSSLSWAIMPKNVILMISDGQGYNTVGATDYWTATIPVYETFSMHYGVSTFSAGKIGSPPIPAIGYDPSQAWSNFNYVITPNSATDSASAATALATGIKVYDGQLNISTTGIQLKTITEIARDLSKSSGVVTTVMWSHATPAGMFAHNTSRNNYSLIANEMLGGTSPLSVIMGAGNPEFDDNGLPAANSTQYLGGDITWGQLTSRTHPQGWSLIQTKQEFEDLANNSTPTVTKVVGTLQAFSTTQQSRTLAVKGAEPTNPSGVAFNTNVPSLATMSKGALNVLNRNPKGFFVMIEGGAVDWANHANNLGRMIEEQMDFNSAVQTVVDWVNANSNWNDTLLVVTADHETGFLWGPVKGTFNEVVNYGKGVLPGAAYNYSGHSNSLVPVYAIGAGSQLLAGYANRKDPVRGHYLDNTEIFRVMNGSSAHVPQPFLLLLSGLNFSPPYLPQLYLKFWDIQWGQARLSAVRSWVSRAIFPSGKQVVDSDDEENVAAPIASASDCFLPLPVAVLRFARSREWSTPLLSWQ
jgi:alkaline phosphatase